MATVIVLVGCYYGYTASGGPVGVGTATAKSMVLNTVMVHIVGMIGTQIFWGTNPRAPIGGWELGERNGRPAQRRSRPDRPAFLGGAPPGRGRARRARRQDDQGGQPEQPDQSPPGAETTREHATDDEPQPPRTPGSDVQQDDPRAATSSSRPRPDAVDGNGSARRACARPVTASGRRVPLAHRQQARARLDDAVEFIDVIRPSAATACSTASTSAFPTTRSR